MGGTACPERGRAGRERPAGSLCRPGPRCSGVGGCRCLSPGHPPQPGPARKSKGSSGRFLSEVGNANTGAHRTLPPSCFCSCQELLAVHVHRACPGGARGSPAVLWAASLGLWEVPPELLTELLQLPWNTEGWLEVSSGSFQRLRWFAPLSPAKFCLRGADTLPFPRWDPEGTTLGPRGRRRAALLCPLPARSLALPGAAGRSPAGCGFSRAGVSWGSPDRSPRCPAPLPTQTPLPGGASRMGDISC